MAVTLYLDRRGLELGLQGKALIIHHDGKYQRSVPLALVERVVCSSSVIVNTSVLANLAGNGIGVSLFGGRKGRVAAHLSGSGTMDVKRRIAQYQQHFDHSARIYWSERLVSHKLLCQLRLLKRMLKKRPDKRYALVKGVQGIERSRTGMKRNTNLNLDTLRGVEGSAARSYFQAYASVLPNALGFNGRNRRPPRDPVNALLSFGYTLQYGEILHMIHAVGLDPWLGLYHEPAHGRASLACDIQELYRYQVEELSWSLTRKRILHESHFAYEGAACLLNKEGRAIFYPCYEHVMQKQRRRMRKILLHLVKAWCAE